MGATWKVFAAGQLVSEHRTERAAIKRAEAERDRTNNEPEVTVVLDARDGSYRASQRVWPTVGDIHTK